MEHELKTDPDVYQAMKAGWKNFEIRFNDRDFVVGDILLLRETRHSGEQMESGYPLGYTGEEMRVEVTYILPGPIYGLKPGWVIMSVEPA